MTREPSSEVTTVICTDGPHHHLPFSADLTHLNRTEVPVKAVDARLVPAGLVLQGQEQQVLGEGSRKAVLDEAPSDSLGRQKRSMENTGPLEDHNWPQYFRDPCDPNPCQNEGVCVNVKGMASCRWVHGWSRVVRALIKLGEGLHHMT